MTRLHEWTLSGLALVTAPTERPSSGYWFETYANSVSLGEPAPSNTIRETLALDGDDARTDRWGNREITFTVVICGYTNGDIADGERVLSQRIGVPGVLEWLPPESGPRSMYRVRTSKMGASFADLPLMWVSKFMAYQVTLNCLPWAYPETVITETFAPGTTTITTGDACTATTNWSSTSTLTAVTFLSLSAIRVGPVTAVSTGGHPIGGGTYGSTGYAATATVNFTGTVAAANYMYIDFAYTLSGFGDVFPQLSVGGVFKSPVASQLQSDGYMRYFWQRQAGPLTFKFAAYGMASGDTATFYIEEFGTATLLPSGSVFALTTKGSVRTEAKLRVSHASTPGIGETLIYADPTMLTHGWEPGLYSATANAPDGTYWVYVQPTTAYAIGDVFSLTVAGQTATTRTEHTNSGSHWIPIGPFQLGGRKSRRLGTVTGLNNGTPELQVALLKNGSGTGYTNVDALLFRESPDTALVHAWLGTTTAYQSFFIEPASIDVAEPGMFAGSTTAGTDAVSALSLVKSWGFPQLVPPTTALWVQCSNTTAPQVSVTHRPPFHTLAAEY